MKNKDEEEKFELEPSNENSAVIIHADATIKRMHSKQLRIITNRKVIPYPMLNISSKSIKGVFSDKVWAKVSRTKEGHFSDHEYQYSSDILLSSSTTEQIKNFSQIFNIFKTKILESIKDSHTARETLARLKQREISESYTYRRRQKELEEPELEPSYKGLPKLISEIYDYAVANKAEFITVIVLMSFVFGGIYFLTQNRQRELQRDEKFNRGFESLLRDRQP